MFIYRDYRWRDLPTLVHRTLKTVAMVMTLIACASSVRLRDGADAAAGEDHRVLPDAVEQQVRHPDADQHHAAGARLPDGHGAAAPDLHADPAAGGDDVRRRSGALRHDHAAQSRHRPADAAGRRDAVRRLRGRQGDDGRGDARDLAVLRRDVRRADARDLHPGDFALAAALVIK